MKTLAKKFLLPLLAALLVFVLFDNDAVFYQQPVALITAARTVKTASVSDTYGNTDEQVTQNLTLRFLNTSRKNQSFQLTNTAYRSQTTGQIYQAGEKVLLTNPSSGSLQILTLKRDAIIFSLLTLFLGLLIAFIRWKHSLFLLLSLALNLVYFIGAVFLDVGTTLNPLLIFSALAALFVASSCFFVLGQTLQMLYTLITTLLSTGLTFAITLLVLFLTSSNGVNFEYVDYVTQNPQTLFFMGCLISVLGAIMDGCGDIVAGLFGLYRQNSETSRQQYFRSGLAIGREITGTLINVLFMIFMAGTLPMALLLLKNGNSWSYISAVALNLGLLQTLISAIGIVCSIPLTSALTSFALTHSFASHKKEAGL